MASRQYAPPGVPQVRGRRAPDKALHASPMAGGELTCHAWAGP